jgi:hypothetical protein
MQADNAGEQPPQPAMSDEEQKKLAELFGQLGTKPKMDNKEDLEAWMANYVATKAIKRESAETSAASTVISVGRKPWLTKFSGDSSEGYDLWRYQLLSLKNEKHRPEDIADAIRASLQGKAGGIVARLGTDVSVEQILQKMDSIFGEVGAEADCLANFFSARQAPTETIAEYSCRLEKLLDLASRQATLPGSSDVLLRKMLWTGLHKDLKDSTLYLYDSSSSFDELRVALRKLEKERMPKEKENASCKLQKATKVSEDSEMKQLKAEMKELKSTLSNISMQLAAQGPSNTGSYNNSYQRGRGNHNGGAQQQPTYRSTRPPHFNNRGATGGPGRGRGQREEDPVCYRCGQRGHLRIGCRVRTDHLRGRDF